MTNVVPPGVKHALPPRDHLQSVLSETSSTSVYRVYDASGKREQAIKILRHEMTDAFYEEVLSSVDRQLILRAPETSGGKIREAARLLERLDLMSQMLFASCRSRQRPSRESRSRCERRTGAFCAIGGFRNLIGGDISSHR